MNAAQIRTTIDVAWQQVGRSQSMTRQLLTLIRAAVDLADGQSSSQAIESGDSFPSSPAKWQEFELAGHLTLVAGLYRYNGLTWTLVLAA